MLALEEGYPGKILEKFLGNGSVLHLDSHVAIKWQIH